MKKFTLFLGLVLLLAQPSIVDARVWGFVRRTPAPAVVNTRAAIVWPTSRAIRAEGRVPNAPNMTRIAINEIPLDATFENAENGVKIQYPSSWQRFDLMERNPPLTLIVMLLSKKQNGEGIRQNINLVVEDLPSPMTLAEYTELGLAVEREFFEDYTLLKSEDVLIAGAYRAHRVLFTTKLSGGSMTFQQVWLLRGNKAHVWTFADTSSAFEEHVKTFERMLDTVTVR